MALAVNLFMMLVALALVAYPLLRSEESMSIAQANAPDIASGSQQAALAEAELDKALGKADENEYKEMVQRLDRAH